MAKKSPPKDTEETKVEHPADVVMGRPTAYRPEYVAIATELCQAGATDPELAETFGVTERTINRWKLQFPEFCQAVKKGKSEPDERVQRSLYHRAMGYEWEEAQPVKLKKVTYADGKRVSEEERVEIVMVRKVVPPDTTAMIFWLKNRKKDEWRDLLKHEHGGVGDFDQMTDDELRAFVTSGLAAEGESQEDADPPRRSRRARGKSSRVH